MAEIVGKEKAMYRRVRFKMGLDVLERFLKNGYTGLVTSELPKDTKIVGVCQDMYDEMNGKEGFWVIAESSEFELTPMDKPVPEIPPVCLKVSAQASVEETLEILKAYAGGFDWFVKAHIKPKGSEDPYICVHVKVLDEYLHDEEKELINLRHCFLGHRVQVVED